MKSSQSLDEAPALQLVYDTAPIGFAVLSPDCRYLRINKRITEICGISVEDHLGRSVREHGGTIDVETEPGVFTEFIITLPRRAAADAGGRN
ncbi:PAS domain-containing protein [Bradyrhizobium sp. AC87j1]|uniref:PAS domain-containing protein n=1 Tax=Bradyrhizobium sp. AC87j1 TaxID=2055894 RepID=UPI001FE121B2|nr:PAS domain-containing protein [Bradyrhizobium sp. AC87j1]